MDNRLQFHWEQYKNSPLYAVLGEAQSRGRSNFEVTKALLEGGIRVIQYRDKTKTTRQKFEECLALRELTKEYKATFIVNDSIEIAVGVGADGIHVGQKDLPLSVVRKIVPAHMLIGLSVNYVHQWKDAQAEGIAHYIGVGPVYATTTKLDAEPVVTNELERLVVEHDDVLAAVAIGGLMAENVVEAQQRGYKRFAMVSALVGADNITNNAKTLLALLTK